MNWRLIDNPTRIQNAGEYTDWKQQISDDCFNQCVYCSIHENPWGGIDHYHIDHFRPHSKFPALKHTITNLYHACPVCNRFKSDDWPNEPDDLTQICYPDPAVHNYIDLYEMDLSTFHLTGRYPASKYLVNRLFLNRAQLIYERREAVLKIKAQSLIDEVTENIKITTDVDQIKNAFELIAALSKHLLARANIVPYRLLEIRKGGK